MYSVQECNPQSLFTGMLVRRSHNLLMKFKIIERLLFKPFGFKAKLCLKYIVHENICGPIRAKNETFFFKTG